MLGHYLPAPARVRVVGYSLKHNIGGSTQQGAISQVGVPRDLQGKRMNIELGKLSPSVEYVKWPARVLDTAEQTYLGRRAQHQPSKLYRLAGVQHATVQAAGCCLNQRAHSHNGLSGLGLTQPQSAVHQ